MTEATQRGSHTRSMASPFLEFDLISELDRLHRESTWNTGQNARTLIKYDDLRGGLMAKKAGAYIPEHKANGRISVQVLSGHIRLTASRSAFDLLPGSLLALDERAPHGLEALEESCLGNNRVASRSGTSQSAPMGHRRGDGAEPVIFTIGHSTRPIKAFVRLLKAHGVQRLIDVRMIPKSRHNPQFNRDQLSPALHRASIHYKHMAGLGGLRHARPDSINTGWRNASFRGYADYMQTPEFGESLRRCLDLAKRERVALMCAEAVPWRCHRSLIADALVARGIAVSEITSGVRARPHVLTPWARVNGTRLTYPAEVGNAH